MIISVPTKPPLFMEHMKGLFDRNIDLISRVFSNGPGDRETKDSKNGTWYRFAKHLAQ